MPSLDQLWPKFEPQFRLATAALVHIKKKKKEFEGKKFFFPYHSFFLQLFVGQLLCDFSFFSMNSSDYIKFWSRS